MDSLAVPVSPLIDNSPFDWRFRQLLEALPAAVYTTDADGLITFYNQAAVELSGREPELGSDRWCVSSQLYAADGRPIRHDESPMAVALKEDRPVRGIEAIMERPDGTRVHFLPFPTPLHDASGALVGAVNMLVDITDRKITEASRQQLNEMLEQRVDERTREMAEAFARLRVSEERFRLLVQGVIDYAIFMLDPDGSVTNWNLGAERIYGYSAAEIVGSHFSRFHTERDRQNRLPEAALDTARRTGRYEGEGRRVRKDGTTLWVSAIIDAIHDGSGKLVGFGKVTRDLTERRAADEQLRQAQKMEAVGQLTGGVAHDFNNLLTAIIGNLEMLTTLLPERGLAGRYAEAALRAASRGARLTEHLLAFSRHQEIRPETVSVNALLSETLILCQKTVGDGIDLDVRLQPGVWACHIDPAQFGAAILNLAANGRDAMSRSGRLTIATENVIAGGNDSIDLSAGEYVVVSVSDAGCGMTADVLAKAFEPFYTTKEVGKGTGLGLSQVYGFAKQSGGSARIESKQGVGTTVRIYIPRDDGPLTEPETPIERVPGATASSGVILVVEDDPDVREMIEGMLSGFGYDTVVARNGPEALAMLDQENPVDLLLTDIVMPGGMNGAELARAAVQLRPDIKILLTSGYAGAEPEARSARAEFPFIAKPYRAPALDRKLREVLAGEMPSRRRV
ncbi:MAG TPA: PAS domain S-box protein [Stellaceae bacterium]|nr:PAS domain S-box protein [Stellaceae bacterium]